MQHLTKWIGKVLFFVMAAALIAYAASRTLDFVNSTLGAGDQVIGYLALFATTGGALAWLSVFLYSSEGIAQKGIAVSMVAVDVLGEIMLFTTDTLLQSGINGQTYALLPEDIRLVVLAMSGLIGLNIIATFAFHIANPENIEAVELHFAEQQIEQAIRKAKTATAKSLAAGIAEREALSYGKEMQAKERGAKAPEFSFSNLFGKNGRDLPIVASEAEAIPELAPKESKGVTS